jgi:hypothetical protein
MALIARGRAGCNLARASAAAQSWFAAFGHEGRAPLSIAAE